MKPHFKHDCPCCHWLGSVDVPKHMNQVDKVFDLYFCKQGGFSPTVIARFGSDGPDYMSGLGFPQSFARQKIDDGLAGTIEEALELVVGTTQRVTEYGLSMAALKAMEVDLLDADLNPV